MKIKLLTLFAALFLSASVFAQTEFIINAGVNSSAFDTELDDGNEFDEARVGWSAGFDFRLGSDETIFFQPGFRYNEFTARLFRLDVENTIEFEQRAKFRTLKLPLNVGINFIETEIIDLYGVIGAVPTALLSSDAFDEVDFNDDDVRNLSLGADAGIGIDLFNLINIHLNYEVGVTDFFEAREGRINMFTAGVGIIF